MAHKTLIDGTSYEVTGGRTLVDGTGYDITGGRTLVDGTGYDVNFGVTWAVYNVVTKYVYSGTVNSTTTTADSTEYFPWSSYNVSYTTTAPSAYSGTYTKEKTIPWKNSFTDTGKTSSDMPFSAPATGYYMFRKSPLGNICRLFYFTKGKTIDYTDGYSSVNIPAGTKVYTTPQRTLSYSKGSTRYDDIKAPDGTYPDNGRKGDYWYVKIT